MQGLFAATGHMDRDNFRDYVSALNLDANFSGIQTIGVIEWVPAARRDAHIAAMHQLGFTGYAIQPQGLRENYAPIIQQREPSIASNRAPLGMDPWADPVRRQAMEKARDSGMVAVSGKVRLGVEPSAATLLYRSPGSGEQHQPPLSANEFWSSQGTTGCSR